MEPTNNNNYDLAARFYDFASALYSGGKIRACKVKQLEEFSEGERVLYAGVGGGEDALLAAKKGAKVTVVELSQEMLDVAENRFVREGLEPEEIETICDDVMRHLPDKKYDVVIANFFLNVFSEDVMKSMFSHLASLVKPGGKLLIADFAPPQGGFLSRGIQSIYYGVAALAFWAVASNQLHPIYDYTDHFSSLGLQLERITDFSLFHRGPCYRTLTGVLSK